MQTRPPRFLIVLIAAGLIMVVVSGCADSPQVKVPSEISAIRSPSLLTRLGVSVDATALGHLGGSMPPRANGREEPMPPLPRRNGFGGLTSWFFGRSNDISAMLRAQPFLLTGADLYRLNCQSCHGPDGDGSPPEVNSLVGPVQGTSAALLVQRLKEKGRPVDEEFLREVAAGAESDLRQRLREGGEKMPPFERLSDDETTALVAFLRELADIPDTVAPGGPIVVPVVRVGEHVVKGTCHTCHDATGPGRHAMMMTGSIPSLASMPVEQSFDDFVAKVREGVSPPMMMMRMMMGPSKMPDLPYLTSQELAAALVYLTALPPEN